MHGRSSRLFAFVIAIALCGAGCGPEVTPPGAAGEIRMLPGQDGAGFSHVELRLQPDADGGDLNLNDVIKDANAKARFAFDALPAAYEITADEESSDVERWRITAWLSRTESAEAPADGDLVGSELFDLADCSAPLGDKIYCGTTRINVLIDAIVQVQ